MRSTAGRAVFPRVLDVMEARSAAVLRGLFDDPRLSVQQPSWRPVVRRLAVVVARFGFPLQVAQALVGPAARPPPGGPDRDAAAEPSPLPASAGPAQRLDAVVELLGSAVVTVVPRVMPAAAAGFGMLGLACRLLGDDARPGDLRPCCAVCRTT